MRRSPTESPAVAAGDPGATEETLTPWVRPQSSASAASIPSPVQARLTSPNCMRSSDTLRARSMGMANPSPSLPPLREKMEVFTPMTCPRAFTRGPPELPGLMEASVWIIPR
jgi:hypothetical protein